MGFRSTFITEESCIRWPVWFVEKYQESVWFPPDSTGLLASRSEYKQYGVWQELLPDIQRAIDWKCLGVQRFVVVFLHECGGLTRYAILPDRIEVTEPATWRETDESTHNYCYGCSDAPPLGRVVVEVDCAAHGHCYHAVDAADCLAPPRARRKAERCCRCGASPAYCGPDPVLEGNEAIFP